MKIMIDTNIFISAILNPKGRVAEALNKALSPPFYAVTSDYVLKELEDIFRIKFPNRISELESFFLTSLDVIQIIPTPIIISVIELTIRDPNDRPIIRTAIYSKVDYLLTGDKDFLESSIQNPIIISVSDFLQL